MTRMDSGPVFKIVLSALALTVISISLPVLANGPHPTFAGISASAEDAAVAGQNPAAMTLFNDRQGRFELLGFFSESTWEGRLGENGPVRITEDDGSTVVPVGALVIPLPGDWRFGFTVQGVGFGEDYPDDWPGRYFLQEYDLLYLSAFPSIAKRITDRLSVAASLALTYTSYEQRKAVPNLEPGFGDGSLQVDTDGLAVGWGLSALYEISDRTRLGLVFRSSVEPSLSGQAHFSGLGPRTEALLEEAGLLDARVDVTSRQPQAVTAGLYHEFGNGHAVTLDLAWSEFSDFKLAEIYLDGEQLNENTQSYEDILALSGSWNFPVAPGWRLGFGGFLVNDMIGDENRTLTLRLDDLWSVGAGVEWRWRPDRMLTVTLNYLESGEGRVRSPDVLGIGSVTGRYTQRHTIYLRAALSFGPARG